MEQVQEGYEHFIRLCSDPENEHLADQCVLYLDHILLVWARFGVLLATRRDRSGPSSNVYIVKGERPMELIVLDRNNAITERGHFAKRASEIVGVYTQPRSRHARLTQPELLMFFKSYEDSKSFSHTFQSHSYSEKEVQDARREVVIAMAKILSVFIQTSSLQPALSVGPSKLVPMFQSLTTPPKPDKSQVVEALNELFKKGTLSQIQKSALMGLGRVDIRTHDRAMSLVMKTLSAKEANPQALHDIYTSLFTRRGITQNQSRETDLLLLRQLKSIYTRQYGYEEGIAKCVTLDQLRALLPPDLYTTLARTNEIKQQLAKQAKKCEHVGRHTAKLLAEQFLDLSNPGKSDVVKAVAKELDSVLEIPVDYIPCRICGYEFICGHRALYTLLENDIVQYTQLLERFAVHSVSGPTTCTVCGTILEVERVQVKSIRRATREEIIELSTKKGFQLCQRLTRAALRFVRTQLLFEDISLVLYVYDYIYPYVKQLLLEYKQTFEYKRRLAHSLATAIAAFFSRLEDGQRVIFLVREFHSAVTQSRDVVVTQEQFVQQVNVIKSNPVFDSGLVPREQDFSEVVSLIKRKPILGAFLEKQGLEDVFAIAEKFGHKDSESGFLVVRLSALYAAALGVKSIKEVMTMDYDELVTRGLVQAAIAFDFMYNYSEQASEAVGISQDALLKSSAPRLRLRATGSAKTKSASVKQPADMYPPSDQIYTRELYTKHCPKASFEPTEDGLDTAHEIANGKCTRCGFDTQDPESYSKDTSKAAQHVEALRNYKSPAQRYVLKQVLNTKVEEAVKRVYREYNNQAIISTAKKLALAPQQIIHMCMFDYVGGYQTGVAQKMTAAELIENTNTVNGQRYYFRGLELKGLPSDLMFVNNHQLDWGLFAQRWGRLQGLMRYVMFHARLPEGGAESFSLVVQFLPGMHANYYVHCQILIYYFFCELLPAIAALNTNEVVIDLVHQMCKKDEASTVVKKMGGYFGQDGIAGGDLEGSIDDEGDQPVEPED